MHADRNARPAISTRAVLGWTALLMLLLFIAFTLYQKYWVSRPRFTEDADLLAELADAEFPDDDPALAKRTDWLQWRGHGREGVVLFPNLLETWPAKGPKELWRAPTGGGYSSFAVRDGALYTMAGGEEGEAVICRSMADGGERWRVDAESGAWAGYQGPRATPTLDGDRLYTVSSAGTLMCLQTSNGAEVWKNDLRQTLGATPPRWGTAYSPLVEGDLVYAIPGGGRGRAIAAFAKADGTPAWSARSDKPGYSSPIAAVLGGRRQIIFFTGEAVIGVSPDKGEVLWEHAWQDEHKVNGATPVIINAKAKNGQPLDYVFITSGYGRGCTLLKIEVIGERLRVKVVFANNFLRGKYPTPVRYRDHLYALDENEDLTCLSLRTGQVTWRSGSARFKNGALIRANDKLIVLGETGRLSLAACDPTEFRELATCKHFSDPRCWALPVLAEGKLLLRNSADSRSGILCLDVQNRK